MKHPLIISLIILILLGIFYFFVFGLVQNSELEEISTCGDGTLFGECSLNKPYFCEKGILIQNIAVCGCSEVFQEKNESCFSEYFNESLNLNLGLFDFILYKGVLDYLTDLPRTIEYSEGEIPKRIDFKFKKINNELQRESLIPLVTKIENLFPNSKDVQAKIAIDFVQNIPYEEANFVNISPNIVNFRAARYPYQVIYESAGSCEGKSELLVLLLRELGYKTAIFYYASENHEAVGIGCPVENSLNGTGYCFVETTVPSPISFSSGVYLNSEGSSKLSSVPEILPISEGISLSSNLEDYRDAERLEKLFLKIEKKGKLNSFQINQLENLRIKYGLNY